MLHQKYFPTQGHDVSLEKSEYHYLYEKDDETKGHIVKDENEGTFEWGNDFINCKNILNRDSKDMY